MPQAALEKWVVITQLFISTANNQSLVQCNLSSYFVNFWTLQAGGSDFVGRFVLNIGILKDDWKLFNLYFLYRNKLYLPFYWGEKFCDIREFIEN